MRASLVGSDNRWCLGAPRPNLYAGSQHQTNPGLLAHGRAATQDSTYAPHFSFSVVPERAWQTYTNCSRWLPHSAIRKPPTRSRAVLGWKPLDRGREFTTETQRTQRRAAPRGTYRFPHPLSSSSVSSVSLWLVQPQGALFRRSARAIGDKSRSLPSCADTRRAFVLPLA